MIKRSGFILAALCMLSVGAAYADPHDFHDHRGPGPGPRPGEHIDARFGVNHYYPTRGVYVHDLPRERIIVNGPRGRYWYSGGVWYNYGPRGYVVVGAPIGVFVPVLPP